MIFGLLRRLGGGAVRALRTKSDQVVRAGAGLLVQIDAIWSFLAETALVVRTNQSTVPVWAVSALGTVACLAEFLADDCRLLVCGA